MYLNIEDLRQREFQLSGIHIIQQKPAYRKFSTRNRHANGFLYIIDGSCRYMFAEESFVMDPGSLVYLPRGSVHRMDVLTESIEFYRIDFTLTVENEETNAFFMAHVGVGNVTIKTYEAPVEETEKQEEPAETTAETSNE